ncbi:choice-of-anchor A family protein [Streptomyces filamentosus]|uniref:choice-of-anchor A family protein n=1 Tax=Streptomyces filamentosus TaxID=67294 RepID=UPI001F2A1765|nr:choice-of-anchor A family protein [Streptomyces filamentosus]
MKKPYSLLGIAVCTVAVTLAAGVPAAVADTVDVGNPVSGDNGFDVVVETDALLGSTESEGPVAIGGDLSYGAGYNVALHTPGTFRDGTDARPTALLVGGRISSADSSPVGVLKVLQDGYVKVGDLTGSDVVTQDANNAAVKTQVVATAQGHDSTPRIELTVEQPALSVGPRPGLMDFTDLFADYRDRADALATCAGNVEPEAPGRLALDGTRTNVLRLTGAELNALSEITFLDRPTEKGPLVIDVDTTATGGVFTWDVPNLAGVTGADAPYILWNFADATAVTIATGDTIEGTIYAPRAHVTDVDPADIEGDIIAKALTAGPLEAKRAADADAGEIHHFPFAATLSCENAPTPTPSPPRPNPPRNPPRRSRPRNPPPRSRPRNPPPRSPPRNPPAPNPRPRPRRPPPPSPAATETANWPRAAPPSRPTRRPPWPRPAPRPASSWPAASGGGERRAPAPNSSPCPANRSNMPPVGARGRHTGESERDKRF